MSQKFTIVTEGADALLLKRMECMEDVMDAIDVRFDELIAAYSYCCNSSSSSSSSTSSSSSSSSSTGLPNFTTCTDACAIVDLPASFNVETGAFVGDINYEIPGGTLAFVTLDPVTIDSALTTIEPSIGGNAFDRDDYIFYGHTIPSGLIAGDIFVIGIRKIGAPGDIDIINFTRDYNPINSTASTAASYFTTGITKLKADWTELYTQTVNSIWTGITRSTATFGGPCVTYMAIEGDYCVADSSSSSSSSSTGCVGCDACDQINIDVTYDGTAADINGAFSPTTDFEATLETTGIPAVFTNVFSLADWCYYAPQVILTDTTYDRMYIISPKPGVGGDMQFLYRRTIGGTLAVPSAFDVVDDCETIIGGPFSNLYSGGDPDRINNIILTGCSSTSYSSSSSSSSSS